MTSETYVKCLVESAFSEIECDLKTEWVDGKCTFLPQHASDQYAYVDYHGCVSGFLCRAHYEYTLAEDIHEWCLDYCGHIFCEHCPEKFYTVDAFRKVYVL